MSKTKIAQLRRVMKRAWVLVRLAKYSMSGAMRRAWAELKDRIARLGSKHEHQEPDREYLTPTEFCAELLTWTLKMVVRPKERTPYGTRLGRRVMLTEVMP